ncbi:hypothetical protein J3Q64DRAFT_1677210 [Phycomyces blakesleeanus]|uniref:Uncharacterized protein n=1 Tax=Phycomyces blakesleeanus TaxID=4837 RepID=A0ABR3AZG1_PHYBL
MNKDNLYTVSKCFYTSLLSNILFFYCFVSEIPQLQYIQDNLIDCITEEGEQPLPTFSCGIQMSSIDYIFASPELANLKHKSSVDYINPSWFDHFLVSTTLSLVGSRTGKGIWHANLRLGLSAHFCQSLSATLQDLLSSLHNIPSSQDQWEKVKAIVCRLAKQHSRRSTTWWVQQEKALQSKCNHLMRKYKIDHICDDQLPVIERQLQAIQHENVEILAL